MRQYYPQLLSLGAEDVHSQHILTICSSSVPSWMFLQWIPQMLAILDQPEASTVIHLLTSIAKLYPQALAFPVMLSSENSNFSGVDSRGYRTFFAKLKQMVTNDHLCRFVDELKRLTNPYMTYIDWLQAQDSVIKRKDLDTLRSNFSYLKNELLVTMSKSKSQRLIGKIWIAAAKKVIETIFSLFGKEGRKLFSMSSHDYSKAKSSAMKSIKAARDDKRNRLAQVLKDYSPWLYTYRSPGGSFDIEIPGQYSGNQRPIPEEHAKIEGFDEKLLVMPSMRQPMRLTFRGSDEKEYRFLVKAGEDLRTDARMQQLFAVMNQALASNPACRQRRLSLRTYSVIPMTTRIGILEWVANTRVLKEMIDAGMTDVERNLAAKSKINPMILFQQFVKRFSSSTSPVDQYKSLMLKASRKERQSLIRPTMLRSALVRLSTTTEAFLRTRQYFGRTLATMGICQYILGIGDRHLSNTMIDLHTGGVVGIDFGHNFGSATSLLPIPELMPFRLTKQFVAVFDPHKTGGILQEVMIHVIRALRINQRLLLSTMDVFIKEPSLEWETQARGDITQFAKKKVDLVRCKLNGDNPAHIMISDILENQHIIRDEKWLQAIKAIVQGDKENNARATMPEKQLSVEDQVRCLIDHASDPHILGITWAGWEPWK
eukprot:gene2859-5695_t